MPTTIPAATAPAVPAATAAAPDSNSKKCNTPLDYALVRKNNITKITDEYNTLLDTYTKVYTDYSTNISSTLKNDNDYAKLTLKPQTEAYNTQIINISRELMNSVNRDTDLIVEQTQELEADVQKLDTLMNDIKMLRDKNTELKISEKSQEDNVKNTQSGSDDLQFTSQIYMGINMFLVLIVIGLIIYLVYSNFTSKKNNTNTTNSTNGTNGTNVNNASKLMNGMNNLYKNIKVNNQ
jgi:hypothetical protein